MPPIWSKGKCYIVSTDQLLSWHRLGNSNNEVCVLSQDRGKDELRVLADQVEVTIVNSGRVETVAAPKVG